MRKSKSLGYGEDDWKDTLLPNFSQSLVRQLTDRFGQSPWRLSCLYILSLVLFFIIFLRLFHLQIVEGKGNRELADSNRIQIKIIHAPRGVIFDRNGKVLAANSPAFRMYNADSKKARLISREEALALEVNPPAGGPQAANLEVDNVRSYLMGEKTAHLVGYVGEISEAQLKDTQYKNYRQGDRIGQSGIEAEYEKLLKGTDGGEIIEVDSLGKKLRSLRTNPPIPGQNIYLTMDADLQDKIYQRLVATLPKVGSCCGAALAMDPNTGAILALLSLPAFDPNIFTNSVDESAISQIFSRSDSPILNRAVAGTYPPGSTFKIVTSLAGLGSGKITAQTSFEDTGVLYLGTFKFTNWYFNQYGRVEGAVNLLKALQRSNDIYFYQVGRTVGEDTLVDWGRKLRLGTKLDIDLPGEETGLLPTDAWKRETFGEGWYPGDTLHMAIGQGFVLTTPLQILGETAFIAADGTLYKPHILKAAPKILVSNIASADKIKLIKEGLKLVPKQGGTAWPFFTFPIPTAGKTGTAEFGDPKDRTHAWYTGFAPADEPKIVMTILVEGGGEGSSVASPIVKEAFRWYLSPDKNNLIKDIYVPASESARTLGE
ncbi:MAG: penicillin-binding protein 2 [Microgenomates group bacterium Gr01-1014_7]|nr:MAG: penicillin-binding protein 2 [Microgenomates group bacterium Gr01-1014_7]